MIRIIHRVYKNRISERNLCISAGRKWWGERKDHAVPRQSWNSPCPVALRHITLLRFSFHDKSRKMTFKFSDYDCVGFDLDNTLLSYNISNMVQLEYELLSKFMVEERGYAKDYLRKPLLDEDLDFMQKGLILDFDRGNVLKLSSDGLIIRASHGTKKLSTEDISKIYPDQRWDATNTLVNNPFATWNGPVSLKMRALLDYFDMPCSLVFARAIDSLDKESTKNEQSYSVWPDILDGLINMFDGKNFVNNSGGYFPALKSNPERYLRKSSPETISWLRELKKNKVTYLITGSYADFANFTASYALGEDWRSFFDIVISFARKPGFFVNENPFLASSHCKENEIVLGEKLAKGGIYSQGNWRTLEEFLRKISNNHSPRCLYIGDNLIQDVYVPNAHVTCDTVVLSEELQVEGTIERASSHPDEKLLNSKFWDSYYSVKDSQNKVDTFWYGVVKKHSKICISSMEVVAHNGIDATYECFDKADERVSGFYPAKPRSVPAI